MAEFHSAYQCLNCRHCFRKNPLFSLLSDDELDYINSHRTEVDFRKGELIFKQGMPLTHLAILNSGLAKIFIETPAGKSVILRLVKPYEINSGPGMYFDMRHHSSMMAMEDCGVCFIDVSAFKMILSQNASFQDGFIRDFSGRYVQTINHFVVLTQKNMEGRIADALLYLKENVFPDEGIRLLSKQDLADLTAMTRESAMRVIKDFKEEGLLDESNNEILLLNVKALQRIAETG